MFGSSHHVTVKVSGNGRKQHYQCSCGAVGWDTDGATAARQGADHKAKAAKRGK
ncbi:hypothetical protein [Streptomyces sp. SM1]|uniref:hypothetical protein n=1 Tax=Streptomyces sp. SM1 TaxID=402229 RepID=UPI0015E177AD|nr:hypothetical protein [Streptomyces sp. SM1]